MHKSTDPTMESKQRDADKAGAVGAGLNDGFLEDSLMDFINEYFQGDAVEDFTVISEDSFNSQSNNSTTKPDTDTSSSSSSFMMELTDNAFLDSSSDINTSKEISLSRCSDADSSSSTSEARGRRPSKGILGIASSTSKDRSFRRKSISYEIRFMNSKESNGKVKIEILPRAKENSPDEEENKMEVCRPADPLPSSEDQITNDAAEKLRQENSSLRKCILDLERKLSCVERESERIVGELKRIIERKNETISHLELEIAGIRFVSES